MVSKFELNNYIEDFTEATTLDLRFDIAPQPQLRPRATAYGGRVRVYDPKKSSDYKKEIRAEAEHLLKLPELSEAVEKLKDKPLSVVINTYHPIPESWSNKKKIEHSGEYKTSKPDSDNLAKPILDALNGLIWDDDSHIVELMSIKQYVETTALYADGHKRPYVVLQQPGHFTIHVHTL